jgi:hypothetical protein
MTPEQMAIGVLTHVVIPALSALFGGWLGTRQMRRTIRVQRLTEGELQAYDEVLDDLKVMKRTAAAILRDYYYREQYPSLDGSTQQNPKVPEWERESNTAFERIRDAEAIGAVDLSEAAVAVLREFIAQKDGPDRSDGDGIHWEEDAFADRCLRDFQEARLVALGEMTATRWWFRRKRRALADRVVTWWHRRRMEREVRQWQQQMEERERSGQSLPKPTAFRFKRGPEQGP